MTQQMLLQSVLLGLSAKCKVHVSMGLHLDWTPLSKKAADIYGQACFKLSIPEYYFILLFTFLTPVYYSAAV